MTNQQFNAAWKTAAVVLTVTGLVTVAIFYPIIFAYLYLAVGLLSLVAVVVIVLLAAVAFIRDAIYWLYHLFLERENKKNV